MNKLSSKFSTIIFSFFPVLFLGVFVIPDSTTAPTDNYENIIQVQTDTIPMEEVVLDTIITYNPETKQEVIKVVKARKDEPQIYDRISGAGEAGTIDTLIVFNPDTGKETIHIIKN